MVEAAVENMRRSLAAVVVWSAFFRRDSSRNRFLLPRRNQYEDLELPAHDRPCGIIAFVVSAYKYIRKTYDKWRDKNPGDCVCCRSKWTCCSSDSDDKEHEGEEEEEDDDKDEEHVAGSQRWY
ncbi:hypothetical protein pdul_cds_548 [Pandoravirus dulcis]|uniref:Uncharacterized protein n=1 Tax=Pandoravirus dulcis TaxID=1349409 RepID=S4VXP0_9VIRU|nr:hypothetical protein pdul_cds_548 [Pandoravirus dulcis]AGO82659.2 hypothetical protein pdul_cds_548 [Pandoravirus dulcis]